VNEGRIEFDVDWNLYSQSGGDWYVCCADNGDGMKRSELEKYTTTLAVQGAGRNQSLRGNQGMGLKIAGPTRHKKGLLIRSLKEDERTMVQVGWDGTEYGLIPIGDNNEIVVQARADIFPKFVSDQGSGTVVTFLGNTDHDNTFVPGTVKGWLLKYLNTRFFRLSKNGIEVLVRVPTGDADEWPRTPEQAAERMRQQGGKSFNLTVVKGTGEIWDLASGKAGGATGVVELAGDPITGIPPANLHWWVLPTTGVDVTGRTHGGGSFAVLYQNELHDWKTSNQANPFFARLGVLFGKSRITFVLEPKGVAIASDFARAHVLVNGTPVFESDAWLLWSGQFRAQIPDAIKRTMEEEAARLQSEDPDRMKRIRERLKEVMQLLRPRRFRRKPLADLLANGPEVTGSSSTPGNVAEFNMGSGNRRAKSGGRGIGAVLANLDDANGVSAEEVASRRDLDIRWVTEAESETTSIVNGNSNGLHDRAAALAGQDGRTANILLLNREFRGYQAMLGAVNEWANAEGDTEKAAFIESLVMEWTEQKMIEAIDGLRQLENGRTWITEHYDEALSPVSLTAAFMADRYHTLREVKRAVGSLRRTPEIA